MENAQCMHKRGMESSRWNDTINYYIIPTDYLLLIVHIATYIVVKMLQYDAIMLVYSILCGYIHHDHFKLILQAI